MIRNIYILLLLTFGWGQASFEIQNVSIDTSYTSGTLDIYMTNDVPVAGIGFFLSGITVTNLSDGTMNEYFDFVDFSSENLIMGVSFVGNLIPAGEDVLVTVSFTDFDNDDICFMEHLACYIDGEIDYTLSGDMSSQNACDDAGGIFSYQEIISQEADYIESEWGECYDFQGSGNVTGCTDPSACNYDSEATLDDGSCEYYNPEIMCDCAGSFLDVNGDCCSELMMDECWVCNGDGTSCLGSGDLNGDGEINIADIVMMINIILVDGYDESGDVNGDEQNDILDIIILVNIILDDSQNDDIDGDGIIDDEDSDPYNPNECSDTDGDTCDDCISGTYDPLNDGYDPDGDGICGGGDCSLYIILGENELEDIFFNIYNNEDFAYCLDSLEEDPTCMGDLLDLDNAIYLYDTAVMMCPTEPSANFGSAIINLMSIATDPELNELLNIWFEYFNSEDESLSRFSGYSMGIPSRQSSYNDFKSSNIYNIFSKLTVNPTNVSNVLGRNTEDAPYLQELQDLIESEFITRINTSISRIENVINEDYNFMITGEMQGDIYQDDIQMDDTEFYLIKAYMHYYNALFHIITTYDVSEIAVDISDYTVLNKDHPFLTIREGRESYMPFSYQQLNDLYASLDNSFNYLINETDWQENDYIQNDISDDNYNEIVENLDDLEDCLDGECMYTMEGCDNWECSFEYDGYWKDYNCDCVGETILMKNAVSLSNFMNNPPQNLKEYIPDYTISNDECVPEDIMVFAIDPESSDSNTITYGDYPVSWSVIYDSDTYYDAAGGGPLKVRNIKSYTINTINGNSYTMNRPDNWDDMRSNEYEFPEQDDNLPEWINDIQTRDNFNPSWKLIQHYNESGGTFNYYFNAYSAEEEYYLTTILQSYSEWDLISDYYFPIDDDWNGYVSYSQYGVSGDIWNLGGVSASSSSSDPFPCPQFTWVAPTYEQWVAEWTGDNVLINIDSDMGINSLSFAFDGDPFYWSEYGYYARKFSSITINSALGTTTITKPDNWDDMRSNEYEFPEQNDNLPDWIDRYQLRNPMSWHLVSMGSGDLFYLFASDENSEIYSLLYSDNYWGMNSDNTFSDHWIDYTNNGSVLFSYDGTATALTQDPIDITINGLYPEMTLEAILELYKNLFNIDESNWKQTIGGN